MRPLDRFSSIKTKLGVLIVAVVFVTVVTIIVGVRAGVPLRVCGVLAAIFSLGMVQLLARGMTSPLREMAAAATEMSRGRYDRRVVATSRDEVGDLARAFNKMAEELSQVDRMRRDLVANVSHELRTPITALQAVLENVVDGVEEPNPETLRAMLSQVERLGRLVSQLLDLSQLESGALALRREPFEVRDVLDQAVHESRVNAQAVSKAVALEVAVDGGPLTAAGDPERVHQVIANLLDNAIRHSPPHGRVVVAAGRDRDGVRIEVADEGPGIPAEDAARVFERFYRADPARSASAGGTGLGLSIAKWIVDLHGGEIAVESNEPRGCRMVVSLPGAAA
ncbi:MAG TPA: ATP-binding protein [Actinomycetota bacterium]|nr:ATP-binding protein [Actinomycetota bacterium]